MKSTRRAITVIAIVLAFAIPAIQAQPASAASSGDFLSRINSLRASKGLGSLSTNGSLTSVAQGWANKMAAANAISHNPALGSSVSGNWTKLGENVGTGGDVDSIFNALVASPGHYANMVDSTYNQIGIGVAVGSDGRIYTTHDFAAFPGGGSSSAASSSSGSAAKASTPAKPSSSSSAKKPAAPKTTVTTAAQAPPAPPAPPVVPVAPPLPTPSDLIVQGLAEVGGMSVQG